MRAAVFHGNRAIRVEDVLESQIGPGELLLGCSIGIPSCCGRRHAGGRLVVIGLRECRGTRVKTLIDLGPQQPGRLSDGGESFAC